MGEAEGRAKKGQDIPWQSPDMEQPQAQPPEDVYNNTESRRRTGFRTCRILSRVAM